MYNRYIPQDDGSHRRNPVRNDNQPVRAPVNSREPMHQEEESQSPTLTQPDSPNIREKQSAGSFLRGLLPRDLDTGDLLIIVLLLLLAGDSKEDKNNALLTLALYLFM